MKLLLVVVDTIQIFHSSKVSIKYIFVYERVMTLTPRYLNSYSFITAVS